MNTKPVYYHTKHAKSLLSAHTPVIVYDLETTGLSELNDRVIQCSGITYEWNGSMYTQTETFEQYIRPPFPVSTLISDLTGITNEFLSSYPEEKEAFQNIFRYLCRNAIFVGYNNTAFDDKMLNAMSIRQIRKRWTPSKEIDVFRIAKELITAEDLKDRSYKLCNVADYYKVTVDGFHNASIDIINTWKVLEAEMKDYELREHLFVIDAEQQLPPLKLTSLNRWIKAYGRSNRLDRLYAQTNRGEYVVDLIRNTITPKTDTVPEVDPDELIAQMNEMAKSHGYKDYSEIQGGLPRRVK